MNYFLSDNQCIKCNLGCLECKNENLKCEGV